MSETVQIPTVNVHDVPAVPGPDAVLVDVREDHEWAAGHVDGALHIPLGQLPDRRAEIDADARVYVICHLGGRSAQATAWLQQQGVDAVNVDGGMEAWAAAGLPVTS